MAGAHGGFSFVVLIPTTGESPIYIIGSKLNTFPPVEYVN